jgi:hypothetical protein
MPDKIQVAGEVRQIVYLVSGESPGKTRFVRSGGRARLLRDMIAVTCGEESVDDIPDDPKSPIAYSEWRQFPEEGRSKNLKWRMERDLGVEGSVSQSGLTVTVPDKSSVFVLDSGTALEWPAIDNLTVVLSVDHLRAAGACIRRGLSWDLAIEETVYEMTNGASARLFAACKRVVIVFETSGAACFEGANLRRFLYDAAHVEGRWEARRPGSALPAVLPIAATMVRHERNEPVYPLFIALRDGLEAASRIHQSGFAGENGEFDSERWKELLRQSIASKKPLRSYSTAFPHDLFDDEALRTQGQQKSDLLRDLTGVHLEYVAAKAAEVVLYGPDRLKHAPSTRFGDYFTVDRQEIERLHTVRNLIEGYSSNPKDHRPLSIAVFGPAGSGKSFAIKELAKELFGDDAKILEFNLTQFHQWDDLEIAFHQVRDGAARGKIPFVFWDEFDTEDFKWLKHFLAPMQDSTFQSKGHNFPFGKAVFVFAGSVAWTMSGFESKVGDNRDIKGPDFLSRLRGYVDIKGPNPSTDGLDRSATSHAANAANRDAAHFIRRAMILRVSIERFRKRLIGPDKFSAVSPAVVRAFLRVREFKHGARSIDTLVSLSRISDFGTLGPSELPPASIVGMHASSDFYDHLAQGQLTLQAIEKLAEACHTSWYETRRDQGWSYGDPRDEAKKRHPLCKPYTELPESGKELNRVTARLTEAKLHALRYAIRPASPTAKAVNLSPSDLDRLTRIEHDIWLAARLLDGYEFAGTTNEELKLHKNVERFEKMNETDKQLDGAIARSIEPTLKRFGYILVRI